MGPNRKLIVGLGNPGTEYENTYHNVGALALQHLATNLDPEDAENLILFRPSTFMNESGLDVRRAMKKFGILPDNVIVIHDESDLPVGEFKFSKGRGAAGHRGVQSIIDHLGGNEFTRIRIGIRPAREVKRKKAGEFVLKKITKIDHAVLETVFKKVREMIG